MAVLAEVWPSKDTPAADEERLPGEVPQLARRSTLDSATFDRLRALVKKPSKEVTSPSACARTISTNSNSTSDALARLRQLVEDRKVRRELDGSTKEIVCEETFEEDLEPSTPPIPTSPIDAEPVASGAFDQRAVGITITPSSLTLERLDEAAAASSKPQSVGDEVVVDDEPATARMAERGSVEGFPFVPRRVMELGGATSPGNGQTQNCEVPGADSKGRGWSRLQAVYNQATQPPPPSVQDKEPQHCPPSPSTLSRSPSTKQQAEQYRLPEFGGAAACHARMAQSAPSTPCLHAAPQSMPPSPQSEGPSNPNPRCVGPPLPTGVSFRPAVPQTQALLVSDQTLREGGPVHGFRRPGCPSDGMPVPRSPTAARIAGATMGQPGTPLQPNALPPVFTKLQGPWQVSPIGDCWHVSGRRVVGTRAGGDSRRWTGQLELTSDGNVIFKLHEAHGKLTLKAMWSEKAEWDNGEVWERPPNAESLAHLLAPHPETPKQRHMMAPPASPVQVHNFAAGEPSTTSASSRAATAVGALGVRTGSLSPNITNGREGLARPQGLFVPKLGGVSLNDTIVGPIDIDDAAALRPLSQVNLLPSWRGTVESLQLSGSQSALPATFADDPRLSDTQACRSGSYFKDAGSPTAVGNNDVRNRGSARTWDDSSAAPESLDFAGASGGIDNSTSGTIGAIAAGGANVASATAGVTASAARLGGRDRVDQAAESFERRRDLPTQRRTRLGEVSASVEAALARARFDAPPVDRLASEATLPPGSTVTLAPGSIPFVPMQPMVQQGHVPVVVPAAPPPPLLAPFEPPVLQPVDLKGSMVDVKLNSLCGIVARMQEELRSGLQEMQDEERDEFFRPFRMLAPPSGGDVSLWNSPTQIPRTESFSAASQRSGRMQEWMPAPPTPSLLPKSTNCVESSSSLRAQSAPPRWPASGPALPGTSSEGLAPWEAARGRGFTKPPGADDGSLPTLGWPPLPDRHFDGAPLSAVPPPAAPMSSPEQQARNRCGSPEYFPGNSPHGMANGNFRSLQDRSAVHPPLDYFRDEMPRHVPMLSPYRQHEEYALRGGAPHGLALQRADAPSTSLPHGHPASPCMEPQPASRQAVWKSREGSASADALAAETACARMGEAGGGRPPAQFPCMSSPVTVPTQDSTGLGTAVAVASRSRDGLSTPSRQLPLSQKAHGQSWAAMLAGPLTEDAALQGCTHGDQRGLPPGQGVGFGSMTGYVPPGQAYGQNLSELPNQAPLGPTCGPSRPIEKSCPWPSEQLGSLPPEHSQQALSTMDLTPSIKASPGYLPHGQACTHMQSVSAPGSNLLNEAAAAKMTLLSNSPTPPRGRLHEKPLTPGAEDPSTNDASEWMRLRGDKAGSGRGVRPTIAPSQSDCDHSSPSAARRPSLGAGPLSAVREVAQSGCGGRDQMAPLLLPGRNEERHSAPAPASTSVTASMNASATNSVVDTVGRAGIASSSRPHRRKTSGGGRRSRASGSAQSLRSRGEVRYGSSGGSPCSSDIWDQLPDTERSYPRSDEQTRSMPRGNARYANSAATASEQRSAMAVDQQRHDERDHRRTQSPVDGCGGADDRHRTESRRFRDKEATPPAAAETRERSSRPPRPEGTTSAAGSGQRRRSPAGSGGRISDGGDRDHNRDRSREWDRDKNRDHDRNRDRSAFARREGSEGDDGTRNERRRRPAL